jgi:hypothetical protein
MLYPLSYEGGHISLRGPSSGPSAHDGGLQGKGDGANVFTATKQCDQARRSLHRLPSRSAEWRDS